MTIKPATGLNITITSNQTNQTAQVNMASGKTLAFGAYYSDDFERHIKEPEWLRRYITVLDISDVFDKYAQIRCALKRQKRTLDKEIGNFDILIGATALHYGLTVVTDNVKHFEPMPGVKVVNWVERG